MSHPGGLIHTPYESFVCVVHLLSPTLSFTWFKYLLPISGRVSLPNVEIVMFVFQEVLTWNASYWSRSFYNKILAMMYGCWTSLPTLITSWMMSCWRCSIPISSSTGLCNRIDCSRFVQLRYTCMWKFETRKLVYIIARCTIYRVSSTTYFPLG